MPRTFSRETKLAQRMDLLGYTVIEVARGTGINRWRLNDYINHGVPISPRDMMKLSGFLECEPEVLVAETD